MNAPRISWTRPWAQAGWLLLVALVPALLTAAFHPRRPEWGRGADRVAEVSWRQVAEGQEPVLWVDARPEVAYAREHVPGALSLPEAQWEERLPAVIRAWRPGTRIVVYCDDRACDTAQSVARRLRRDLGLSEIFVLQGGWRAWNHARTTTP
jgi:rhodanese-related sulfurtransferase